MKREAGIDRLADAIETHLDLDRIDRLLGLEPRAAAVFKFQKART